MNTKSAFKKNANNFLTHTSNDTGITLIALVVTIIVLIILATISINIIVGENGLIAQAERAKGVYENSADREQGIMSQYANTIANGGKTPEKLKTVAEVIESTTTFTETKQITDGNGDLMWVPQDFKVVEGESIDTGVVIEDGVENQFVWVPVPEINDMVMCKEHNTAATITFDGENFSCSGTGAGDKHTLTQDKLAGKLYVFSGTGAESTSSPIEYPSTPNTGSREPDIVTGKDGTDFDGASDNLNIIQEDLTPEEFKAELQSKFEDMIKSVGYYKGFYIGRYETGNLQSGRVTKAVVKKDREDINNTNWYCMYASSKDIAYKNETEKITSVTSSMIWGCQWDATLNWFLREGTDEVKGYVTDSNGKGWYENNSGMSKKATGTQISENKENEVNKIWDMAGNIKEWTLQACNYASRVSRGGGFGNDGRWLPAKSTYNADFIHELDTLGSRSVLYINL